MRAADLPDISIRQLQYLVAVADSPTWSAAAASVGVSQSALSQGLSELERRIGVPLFESHGRRRLVRPQAAPVLDHARRVVALTGDVIAWSARVRGAEAGRVRLGMIDVAAVVHYPGVLRAYRERHPDVEFHLTVAPSAQLLAALANGTLDVVVCVRPPVLPDGIDAEPLLSEPLVVLAPPGVVIGAAPSWGPWVTFPPDSHTRALIMDALRTVGAPLHVAAESHQPDVLQQMVSVGLGWTVLPRRADLDGPVLVTRELVLARRHSAATDPAVTELAQQLR